MKRAVCVVILVCLEWACSKSPQSSVAHGNRLLAAGKYADAEIEYRKSVVKDPKFAEGYYRLGMLEYTRGHGADALDDLQRAVDFAPGNDVYGIELASVAIEAYQVMPTRKKLYDEAAQEASVLLKKDPNSFDGLRLRGDVLVVDRNYQEALQSFRRANAMRPNDPNVARALAQVLFRLNQDREGEELLQHFLALRKDAQAYDVLEQHYVRAQRPADAESLLEAEIAARPKDVHPRLELADLDRAAGHNREMSQEIEKILADRENFPDGHAAVGDFYAGHHEWDAALAQYRAGLQASAHKDLYPGRMERALEALGKREEAIAELNQMLKTQPNDPAMRFQRAVLLRESQNANEQDQAGRELKALAAQYPQNDAVQYNLALWYWAQGDAPAAWQAARKSAELRKDYVGPRLLEAQIAQSSRQYPAALESANQVLALDPNNSDARLLRAAALVGNQSYREAETELSALSKQQTNSKEVDLVSAALAAGEKDYAKAGALYQRLYKPGSPDLRPLQGLLELCAVEHQTEKAQALLENEIKLQPDSRPLRLMLASLAEQQSKFDLASDQYRWIESKDPKSAQPYLALGKLYEKEGATQEALASYQKAAALAPGDTKILSATALFESNSGQVQQAIPMLKKELALDPNDDNAMNNLAFDLAETGTDLDQALSLAQKVARSFPNDPAVLDTLGWVYTRRGLNRPAIQVLRTLVAKYPKEPAFHYHLGVALLQDKQAGDAKRELLAALETHPAKELASRIQESLSQAR
jgi:tetratricopeptide (TPR) repeat protein